MIGKELKNVGSAVKRVAQFAPKSAPKFAPKLPALSRLSPNFAPKLAPTPKPKPPPLGSIKSVLARTMKKGGAVKKVAVKKAVAKKGKK